MNFRKIKSVFKPRDMSKLNEFFSNVNAKSEMVSGPAYDIPIYRERINQTEVVRAQLRCNEYELQDERYLESINREFAFQFGKHIIDNDAFVEYIPPRNRSYDPLRDGSPNDVIVTREFKIVIPFEEKIDGEMKKRF